LTLRELREYQSNNPVIKRSGIITLEQARELDEGKTPDSWCQGTPAKDVVRRQWEEPSEHLIPVIQKMEERMKDEL